MTNSHPEMNDENNPNDAKPKLRSETLSAETHAALNAAQEHDDSKAKAQEPEESLLGEDDLAGMQAAIAKALGTHNADEAVAEASPAPVNPLQEEITALKDQLIRSVAETENIRKRSERDLADARKYAVTGFARDMANVVENLQLALQNIPEADRQKDEKLNTLTQGVEMTYNELLRVFNNNGIKRIDPKGEKFNHNHHQAVAQVEDAEAEPGTIIQVLQSGYIIHDRLLRPAMVTVAKGPPATIDPIDTEA